MSIDDLITQCQQLLEEIDRHPDFQSLLDSGEWNPDISLADCDHCLSSLKEAVRDGRRPAFGDRSATPTIICHQTRSGGWARSSLEALKRRAETSTNRLHQLKPPTGDNNATK